MKRTLPHILCLLFLLIMVTPTTQLRHFFFYLKPHIRIFNWCSSNKKKECFHFSIEFPMHIFFSIFRIWFYPSENIKASKNKKTEKKTIQYNNNKIWWSIQKTCVSTWIFSLPNNFCPGFCDSWFIKIFDCDAQKILKINFHQNMVLYYLYLFSLLYFHIVFVSISAPHAPNQHILLYQTILIRRTGMENWRDDLMKHCFWLVLLLLVANKNKPIELWYSNS